MDPMGYKSWDKIAKLHTLTILTPPIETRDPHNDIPKRVATWHPGRHPKES